MLLVHAAVVLLFLLLGVLFWRGKGAGLIAGYNTMSPWEKARIDERKLCRFMGKLMFALAACWAVAASGEIFRTAALLWAGMALFFATVIAGVIYANTGDRFKK